MILHHQVEYRTVRIDANTTAFEVIMKLIIMLLVLLLMVMLMLMIMVMLMVTYDTLLSPGCLRPPGSFECSSNRPKLLFARP